LFTLLLLLLPLGQNAMTTGAAATIAQFALAITNQTVEPPFSVPKTTEQWSSGPLLPERPVPRHAVPGVLVAPLCVCVGSRVYTTRKNIQL
jgi:cell division protein FtsN